MALTEIGARLSLRDRRQFSSEAGKAAGSVGKIGDEAEKADRKLSRFGRVALAGGVVAGLGAVALKLRSFSKDSQTAFQGAVGDALKLQRTLGGTLEQTSALAYTAAQSGIDMDSLTKSLGFFSKTLGASGPTMAKIERAQAKLTEARNRDAKTAKQQASKAEAVRKAQLALAEAQDGLGVKLQDSNGKQRSQLDVLSDVAAQFKEMPNGPNKTAMAMKLFGRSGAALIPMLNRGRDGMADLAKEAERLGVVISDDDAQGVKDYTKAQRTLAASVRTLKIAFGRELFPIMTTWANFLVEQQPRIRELARNAIPPLRDAVQALLTKFSEATAPGSEFRDTMDKLFTAAANLAPEVADLLTKLTDLINWMIKHETATKRFGLALLTVYTYGKLAAAVSWLKLASGITAVGTASATAGAAGTGGLAMFGGRLATLGKMARVGGPIALLIGSLVALYGAMQKVDEAPQLKNLQNGTTTATTGGTRPRGDTRGAPVVNGVNTDLNKPLYATPTPPRARPLPARPGVSANNNLTTRSVPTGGASRMLGDPPTRSADGGSGTTVVERRPVVIQLNRREVGRGMIEEVREQAARR